jgi:hypothetical protein
LADNPIQLKHWRAEHQNVEVERPPPSAEVLRLIAESGGTIKPKGSPHAKFGYEYGMPGIDGRTLHMLAKHGYLEARFYDRVTLCPSCTTHHLNLREICPACQRPNLSDEVMLHHFRCGNVGRMSEFMTESGALICPKCTKRLNHLGTQYERLGKMFRCNECALTFQDPPVEARCLSCEALNPADSLPTTDVFSYNLTSAGLAALQAKAEDADGDDLLFALEGPIYRAHVLKTLLRQEIKRTEKLGSPLYVLLVDLPDAAKPSAYAGRLRDIYGVLRDLDMMGQISTTRFAIALPQRPGEEAERLRQRLSSPELGLSLVQIHKLSELEALFTLRQVDALTA